MSDRILVTGAAGFVGAHLVKALIQADERHDILATDVEPVPDWFAADVGSQLTYRRGDLTDQSFLDDLQLSSFDRIYHLAAIVGVSDYLENPLDIVSVNIIATKHILERVQDAPVRFVFLSTSEVYGKNPDVPWDEGANRIHGPPTIDRWNYSTGKSACEHMIHGLARASDSFTATVIRPFNLYGPGQRPNFAASAFVHEVVNDNPPLVYDGGTQTRCFTYIDDFIDGVIRASSRPEGENEVFNLGHTRETSVRELAETVIEVAGKEDLGLAFVDTDEMYGETYEDLDRRIPDVSKANQLLDWEAETDLRTGLARFLEWGEIHYRKVHV